jgi:hypothetical protein
VWWTTRSARNRAWTRRATSSQAIALRARVVLRCADGLVDSPRPGVARAITDEDVDRVIARTLEEMPKDATHWSTRSMAAATGMSQSAVSRIWRAFSMRPHRVDTVRLSNDPLFVAKVRDIVGLYMNPPDKALVLCVDEESQMRALDAEISPIKA